MHFIDQFRLRLISQLINGILNVLQKLLRYFNGIIISISFVPFLPDSLFIFSLILNKLLVTLAALNSTILPLATFIAGISLQYCHKIPDVFE